MGRPCTVCEHPKLQAVDDAIVRGVAYREIARCFAPLTRDSVKRHADTHVSPGLIKVAATQRAQTLLERIEGTVSDTEELFRAAKAGGNTGQALAAAPVLFKGYELIGRATGELKPEGVSVSFELWTHPDFVAATGRLMKSLDPFPEAQIVAAAAIGDGVSS
jgi:hypothetical protein